MSVICKTALTRISKSFGKDGAPDSPNFHALIAAMVGISGPILEKLAGYVSSTIIAA